MRHSVQLFVTMLTVLLRKYDVQIDRDYQLHTHARAEIPLNSSAVPAILAYWLCQADCIVVIICSRLCCSSSTFVILFNTCVEYCNFLQQI